MKEAIGLLAAGILAGTALISGCQAAQTGTVYIMGGAKLKLEIAADDTVKSEEGLNREADLLMENYSGKDKPVEEAAKEYISQMAGNDYDGQAIEVSVMSESSSWVDSQVKSLEQILGNLEQELKVDIVVQTITELNDSDILQELEEESYKEEIPEETAAQESSSETEEDSEMNLEAAETADEETAEEAEETAAESEEEPSAAAETAPVSETVPESSAPETEAALPLPEEPQTEEAESEAAELQEMEIPETNVPETETAGTETEQTSETVQASEAESVSETSDGARISGPGVLLP